MQRLPLLHTAVRTAALACAPVSVLVLVLSASGCALAPAPGPVRFTVLHTNDHHGRAWPNRDGEYGLAARKTLVDTVRAEVAATGGHVLLLDAGDVNTGTPESDLLDAEPDFRGMTLLGYDAMSVGNHEFDKTPAVLAKQREAWSGFPWLAANLQRDGRPMFEPYKLFPLGGVKVAVLGLTTDETERLGAARRHPGLQIERPAAAAQRWLPKLKAEADIVIVLSHMGHYPDGRHGSAAPGDVELAREVSGIDVIVGGHSHSLVCMAPDGTRVAQHRPGDDCRPDRQNGSWILQAGDWGRYVGRADFEWQPGRLELKRYALMPVNLKGVPGAALAPDAAVTALLQPLAERGRQGLSVELGRVVGLFDGSRENVRSRPTTLGRLVTQAMREMTGADVGLTSAGGLRDSLREGPLQLRDLLQVLPFGNRVVTIEMSGSALQDYLQKATLKTPGSGAYLQQTGASYRLEAGTLHELRVGGKPIDPLGRYRVVMPSFVAGGGDGYPDLRGHAGWRDSGWTDVPLLRAYIERRGGVLDAADFMP
jgi:5'-nucleotidase/UDP-sugar diphosphatase